MRRKITVFFNHSSLLPFAEYRISGTFFCINLSKSDDCCCLCIWFYERKKRRTVDWLFHGLLLDILQEVFLGFYALLYMYVGYFNGFFPENVLPGRYQTADASDRGQRFLMQSDHLFPRYFYSVESLIFYTIC